MSGHCRICFCQLPDKPLLLLRSQPAMAQHLPEPGADSGGLAQTVDLQLKECPDCGVVQLDNPPVAYYREVIRAGGFSPEMQRFRKRQFAAFSRKYHLQGKRLLEPGCGAGEYLQCWQDVEVCGMEYSPELSRQAREKGFTVWQGYPGESIPPGGPYSAFAILSWLEHLPDLPQVLRNLRASLTADAAGLVEVPDFDMICRRNLFSEFILDHLFYFSRKTLRSVLQMNGFEVLHCRSIWHGYILSAEVRRRTPLSAAGFLEAQTGLLNDMHRFLAGQNGKTAIWGAGHQALALLASCDTLEKISCVVDSAPFKQGHLTPGSGLLIVSPEHLLQDPPAAILIIAGSYNREIAALIRKRFASRFRLACVNAQKLQEL